MTGTVKSHEASCFRHGVPTNANGARAHAPECVASAFTYSAASACTAPHPRTALSVQEKREVCCGVKRGTG
jgi:hypothetical protein